MALIFTLFFLRSGSLPPETDLLVVRPAVPPHVAGIAESLTIVLRSEIFRIQTGDNFPILLRRAILPPRFDRIGHQFAFADLVRVFFASVAPQIILLGGCRCNLSRIAVHPCSVGHFERTALFAAPRSIRSLRYMCQLHCLSFSSFPSLSFLYRKYYFVA